MSDISARLVGVELYFEDLEGARKFYLDTLGLPISDEQPGHHAKFGTDAAFVCLETKGSERYPSRDKAVLFFEVHDLRATVTANGGRTSYARSPIGRSFTTRKDTTFCSSKPVPSDRCCDPLSCQFSAWMLSWPDSGCASSPRGARHFEQTTRHPALPWQTPANRGFRLH